MNSYEDIYNTICRVCLSHSKRGNMVPLFDTSDNDGLSCYGKSVITFANVLLKSDDNFPPMMCQNCVLLLKQAIRFKLKCENSDARLKKLMKMKHSSKQNYHEILCQYTFFNYYFPANNSEESSHSIDKVKSIVTPIISDQTPTENMFNLRNKTGHKNSENNDKTDEICSRYSRENNLPDYNNDADDILEKKCKGNVKGSDVKILENLEKMFNSDINFTESQYNDKFTYNKCKKLKIKTKTKNNTTFVCTKCERVLKNRLTYNRHMQRHNGRRFMCENCGKSFLTQTELNIHQVASHGIGSYLQCNYCLFKAPRKLTLIEHIRLHTGERPYTCDKCGLTFRRRAIWRKHLIYHTEKNFQCPHCPKKFFRHCAMLAHVNNIHDRVYVFMCSKCGATYAKTVSVRKHLSEKHGIPKESQGKIIRVMRSVTSGNSLR